MDNKQEFIKGKLEALFLNTLESLETSIANKLDIIEKMKYEYHDSCILFNSLVLSEEKPEHLETNPNKKVVKKEEEQKKPLKTEENRSKTPNKTTSKPLATKPRPKEKEKTNEASKTNEKKKVSTNGDESKKEPAKNTNQAKTAEKGMKKSPTVGPPRKTPNKPSQVKPKRSNKKPFENTKGSDTKKTNDEDIEESKEENIKNCISNIKIAPQFIPKYIYKIPNELKENNQIAMLYILSKTSFLKPKEKYELIISFLSLFKFGYNSSLSFMLDTKRATLKEKINEIETLLSSYGDLESYLSKSFIPSKTAQNSLLLVTKEEEVNLSKREDLPKEIGLIFQFVLMVLDEAFDESLPINQLITHILNDVLPKYEAKDISKFIEIIH